MYIQYVICAMYLYCLDDRDYLSLKRSYICPFTRTFVSSQVYKSKTEAAKKEYLKALAAYRASLVSKVRNCFFFSNAKCVTVSNLRSRNQSGVDIFSPSRLQQSQLRPRLSAQYSRPWPPPAYPQAWCCLHPSTSTPPCHQLPRPSNKPYHGPLPQNLCR